MRKILISLLLASVAASPALADSSDWSGPHKDRQNQPVRQANAQSRDDARAQRQAERPQFQPRPQFEQGRQFQPQPRQFQPQPRQFQPQGRQFQPQDRQFQPQDRPFNRGNPGRFAAPNNGANFAGQYNGSNYYPGRQRVAPQAYNEPQRDWRAQQRADMRQQEMQQRELRQSGRPVPTVMRAPHQLVVSNVPRPGTQPPPRYEGRGAPEVQWNTRWRDDDRYDWRDYRDEHRSIFHIGFYYDPYGWDYTPFQIGWRLWPGYYQSQYWISDPWMYRLPFAPPGYVWVRYWNDALLVDTFSGTVVDVIPGFFW